MSSASTFSLIPKFTIRVQPLALIEMLHVFMLIAASRTESAPRERLTRPHTHDDEIGILIDDDCNLQHFSRLNEARVQAIDMADVT